MQNSPLHEWHLKYGGRMVDFAGWNMPICYDAPGGSGSIRDEHVQVRTSGGFFDVSHMGRLYIKGRHARRLLERMCTRRISNMQPGQCRYTLICNERGGVRDDALVYKLEEDDFILVCNASNREKIVSHISAIQGDLVAKVEDRTLATAMVAIQGPRVFDLIKKFSSEIPTLKKYRFVLKNYFVMKLVVSRTGYTGEDGVEVILPAKMVEMALKLLLKDVDEDSAIVRPAGLGARDTLRLEAGMPLYGHELGEDISALACGLDFAVNLDKEADERGEPCIGLQALRDQAEAGGPRRLLVGLVLDGRRTPRQHMTVRHGDVAIGEVTSGCMSPTLERPIAMAYVDREHADAGTDLLIDTGKGSMLEAQVTPLPFYKAPAPQPAGT